MKLYKQHTQLSGFVGSSKAAASSVVELLGESAGDSECFLKTAEKTQRFARFENLKS